MLIPAYSISRIAPWLLIFHGLGNSNKSVIRYVINHTYSIIDAYMCVYMLITYTGSCNSHDEHGNMEPGKHLHMLAYTTSFNLFQLPSIPFDFIQLRSTSSNLFYSCNNRICLGTIPCKSHLLSKPFHSNPTCLRTIRQSCICIRTLPHKSDLPSTGRARVIF